MKPCGEDEVHTGTENGSEELTGTESVSEELTETESGAEEQAVSDQCEVSSLVERQLTVWMAINCISHWDCEFIFGAIRVQKIYCININENC